MWWSDCKIPFVSEDVKVDLIGVSTKKWSTPTFFQKVHFEQTIYSFRNFAMETALSSAYS